MFKFINSYVFPLTLELITHVNAKNDEKDERFNRLGNVKKTNYHAPESSNK